MNKVKPKPARLALPKANCRQSRLVFDHRSPTIHRGFAIFRPNFENKLVFIKQFR
jgi:hypothetical protein